MTAGPWVYQRTEDSLYTVGYYTPAGEWLTDSDHDNRDSARDRTHYLNGCETVELSRIEELVERKILEALEIRGL